MTPETATSHETGAQTDESDRLPRKARPLVEYLRGRVRADGQVYLKSRFIAEDLPLSSKEVGAYMRQLADGATELRVEAWAYTNGTTWLVAVE